MRRESPRRKEGSARVRIHARTVEFETEHMAATSDTRRSSLERPDPSLLGFISEGGLSKLRASLILGEWVFAGKVKSALSGLFIFITPLRLV